MTAFTGNPWPLADDLTLNRGSSAAQVRPRQAVPADTNWYAYVLPTASAGAGGSTTVPVVPAYTKFPLSP